jgi:anhydro-N-acetylmuramic acid kinase
MRHSFILQYKSKDGPFELHAKGQKLQDKVFSAIGLMSGTSMDGIDLALIKTDGLSFVEKGPWACVNYTPAQRAILRQAIEEVIELRDRNARPGILAAAEAMITAAHAQIVSEFLAAGHMRASDIDVVGFHGQTVLHRPQNKLTVQLGDGAALAQMLKIPVVFDMRAADIAAGGQGAPLVPVFHQALVLAAKLEGPIAVVNFGGVGNITYIDGDADPIAFDTGPGNALIDDEMRLRFGEDYDKDGRVGGQGQVNQTALAVLMAHPYFKAKLPKSLDRNAFSREPVSSLANEEAIATLTAFTAESLRAATTLLPIPPGLWVIAGGGALNPTLMAMISNRLAAKVVIADDIGWPAQLMEAQAWAYLAVRSLKGLPLTFPTTTGVPMALTGGTVSNPF